MYIYKIKIGIRNKDIDGNKIDTKKEINQIIKSILKFWNVEEVSIERKRKK